MGRTLSNILLLLLFSTTCLGLSEAVVRLTSLSPQVYRLDNSNPESAYSLSDNPILGYEFKPGFTSETPDSHETFDFINSYGQRDFEHSREKTVGKTRIILLGDSVVAGNGIRNVSDTLAPRLQQSLGESYEVLAFGVGGYCTFAEIELLRVKALQFRPDMVILVFVENDFSNMNSTISARLAFRKPEVIKQLFVRSDLFRLAALRFNWFHLADETLPQVGLVRNMEAIGNENVDRGLALLSNLAETNSFKSLLVIWPHFDNREINDRLQPALSDSPEELLIEQLGKTFKIPTVRLSKLFLEDFVNRAQTLSPNAGTPNPRRLYTIGDGVHPNSNGTKAAAAILAKLIISKRIF